MTTPRNDAEWALAIYHESYRQGYEAGALAMREAAASWHHQKSVEAMALNNVGSSNQERRNHRRVADWHDDAAAAIRAIEPEKLEPPK